MKKKILVFLTHAVMCQYWEQFLITLMRCTVPLLPPKRVPNMNAHRNDSSVLCAPSSLPAVANGNRSSSTARCGQCLSAAVITQ